MIKTLDVIHTFGKLKHPSMHAWAVKVQLSLHKEDDEVPYKPTFLGHYDATISVLYEHRPFLFFHIFYIGNFTRK